jgi:predicted nucleic acid-binding protein
VAVVDACVLVDVVSPAQDGHHAIRLFRHWEATGARLSVPRLVREEVLNALLTGIRRKRWTGEAADMSAGLLDRMPLHVHDDARDLARAWELARRYDNWPVYDMLCVALAERLGETLVTIDERLRRRLAHLGWVVDPQAALAADSVGGDV